MQQTLLEYYNKIVDALQLDRIAETVDTGKLLSLLSYDPANPMLFNTGLFMMVFIGFLLIYRLLSRWKYPKLIFTIAFSLFFYYKSSGAYDYISGLFYWLIPVGITISDYCLGLILARLQRKWLRKSIVILNVLLNVGMLVYFKYFNLLAVTLYSIIGSTFNPLVIFLPAGISFLTFRSISYLVDIYRGKLSPTSNFIEYLAFLTFFPPLLAGPVVRATDMLPQIRENCRASRTMVSEGLFLIMMGLVKKVIIADYISGNFIDRIFDNPSLYSGFEVLMGLIGFPIQIYCDFSGYSDMAIGIALLMGYRFLDNFNSPYKSQNPSEFWKRWHISLSSWLMDYVYIPLGGNRRGKFRQYVNLMLTMLIGGLWHGASWMYVLWGGYNGALLIGHKTMRNTWRGPKRMHGTRWARIFNITITLVLTVVGMTIFRADSLQTLQQIWTSLTTNFHANVAGQFVMAYPIVVGAIAVAWLLHFTSDKMYGRTLRAHNALPWILQAVVLAVILFLVIQTRQSSLVPFIYMQY